jgi:glyoxalase family protein
MRGIHGVTLWVADAGPTERVLVDTLGFRAVHERGGTRRYAVGDGAPGRLVDVRAVGRGTRGAGGAGTVHHVAFAVANDQSELIVREHVRQAGLQPTPVIDRTYFHSVYFREPGGVLFEVATDPPGFAVDEPADRLGERLMLPPQHERRRAEIEAVLPPLDLPGRPGAAATTTGAPGEVSGGHSASSTATCRPPPTPKARAASPCCSSTVPAATRTTCYRSGGRCCRVQGCSARAARSWSAVRRASSGGSQRESSIRRTSRGAPTIWRAS